MMIGPVAIVVLGAGTVPADHDQSAKALNVRPILSANCFACHGPDEAARMAEVRLDTREGVLATNLRGAAIVTPGDPDASLLWKRITATDPNDRMPPASSNHALNPDEIEMIRRWIEAGAPWQEHWAFMPPAARPLPDVIDTHWPQDSVDVHVLAALEAAGLKPSPPANGAVLLRRAAFDLTGLPPTVDDLAALNADAAPGALERAIDRLLASDSYGEHMAATWMDLARYADTYGYQNDVGRHVWPWRDWVIRAYNDNLPFDEFITWQLAGDLLPDATRDQRLATAFNRLHRQTNEGGSVEEEFRQEYVADRVNTFGTSVLGLTTECARCHDHKFDPLSQREYFALTAFFDDIDECGLYSHFTAAVPTPALDLPTPPQAAALDKARAHLVSARAAQTDVAAERHEAFEAWLVTGPTHTLPTPAGHWSLDDVASGTLANSVPDAPAGGVSLAPEAVEGMRGTAARLSGDNKLYFPDVAHVTRADPFTLSMWLSVPDAYDRAVVMHRSRSWTDAGSQGYELLVIDGALRWSLIHFWPGDAISVQATQDLPVNEWVHVAVRHDGSATADGLAIFVNGKRATTDTLMDRLTRPITGGGPGHLTVGERFRDNGYKHGIIDEVRVDETALTDAQIAELHAPGTLAHVQDEAALFELFQLQDEPSRRAHAAVHDAHVALHAAQNAITQIMTMRASQQPRQAFLLARGRYDQPTDPVDPGVPAALGGAHGTLVDRLDLARWVTRDDHPLTARVAVNRLWAQVFGQGLVDSPDDFGSQGGTPRHQALLDMLALDYIESGWDTKAMLRRLLATATWRQQSAATAEARTVDRDNRLLARGSARRLTAEEVRDQALVASGLLVPTVGGPPVYPPQPPGLWADKSVATYPVRQGADRWRRSVYTYWKRTSPPPSMMLFDASHRETCVAERSDTTTPLQALVLLNDEQFVEAARVLAERALRSADAPPAQIAFAFKALTSRDPDPAEARILAELLERQHAIEANISPLAEVGNAPPSEDLNPTDVAAMTVVCSTIMNTDAALMRR